MRKLRLYIAQSLDGKIARKDDSIDWLPDINDEDYGYQEFYDSIDAVVMGYKTYEVCLKLGPWYYKDKRSYVFSRHADKEVIPEATLVTEDPVTFMRKMLQEEGKDIWLVGGGQIIKLMHDAGLIDEYIISTIPIVLGEGPELFPSVTKETPLVLTRQKAYSNGLILSYYDKKAV